MHLSFELVHFSNCVVWLIHLAKKMRKKSSRCENTLDKLGEKKTALIYEEHIRYDVSLNYIGPI